MALMKLVTIAVTALPACGTVWTRFPDRNTYNGFGSVVIGDDANATRNVTWEECKGICDNDTECTCINHVYLPGDGVCMLRKDCVPANFLNSSVFTVHMKDPSNAFHVNFTHVAFSDTSSKNASHYGTPINGTGVTSVATTTDCMEKCVQNVNCTCLTLELEAFPSHMHSCYLFEDCDATVGPPKHTFDAYTYSGNDQPTTTEIVTTTTTAVDNITISSSPQVVAPIVTLVVAWAGLASSM